MHRRALVAAVTVAGVAGALLCAGGAAAAGSATSGTAAATASVVRLPTGDAVRVSAEHGKRQVSVVAADRSGVTGSFEQLAAGGHEYVLPGEVRPLLGILDPSLFDVTALTAAAAPGRIPVTLTFARGSSVAVPGLTVTAHTATSAQGYLAPTAAFRDALVQAAQAATGPGGSAPASLFGGVTRLAVTGATPPTVQPEYPQVTLIVDVLDATGRPAPAGVVGLINTDKAAKFVNFLFYDHGEARVSLPYGHYSAITDVGDFGSGGTYTDQIIPVADFDVTADMQHLTMDAADATAVPSVNTPRPADVLSESLEFDRSAKDGGSLGSSFGYDASSQVFVAPTPQAQVGTLHWLSTWSLAHESGAAPYSYDLSFAANGSVPADQANSVQGFQLATIASRYYNDRHRESEFVRTPLYPFQFVVFSSFLPLPTPVARTEYVYGDPTAIWTASLLADPTGSNPFGGEVDDDFRVYPQGAHLAAAWLRGPLAPKPLEQTSGDTFYSCPDCRSAHTMSVLLAPFVDTTPGHFGGVSDPKGGVATHFALFRDNTRLAGGPDFIGAQVPVPAKSALYRLHLAVDRSADRTLTSTSTVTDLTFRSAAGAGAPLPAGWSCDDATPTSGCTVLPVLTAQVPLPTDLNDRLPVGDSSFVLTVAPYHGAGTATVTSAQVLTRIGSGPFQPADLTPIGNGRFQVTLHNPAAAAGQGVTLRVIAADDAGDSITQTTTDAYLVATS